MARVYEELARAVAAYRRGNSGFQRERIQKLMKDHLPSGSGFDRGTAICLDSSNADRLVFVTEFHHMNETGYYCGWTKHRITVTPSLAFGFDLKISGPNKNNIREYIESSFASALDELIEV